MVDKIVPTESTEAPFYDDYSENKDFHRILFRPGFAVQARELTQLQTILQKQIDRFGRHIFKNGSIVTGGEITFQGRDELIRTINLQSQFNSVDIVANNFNQKYITANVANTSYNDLTRPVAYVLVTSEQTTSDPPILVVKPLNAFFFPQNLVIQTTNTDTGNSFAQLIPTSNAVSTSSVVSINEGVFFFDGFFIKVQPQTIFLDKYSAISSYRVGLEIDDSIVDYGEDTTLLDPALEATNYQAPGASRYKITARLAKRSLDSTDDTKFIELLRIEDGTITKKINYPIYSEIEKTLARRTFDESGNYTVRPFAIELADHIPARIQGNVTITSGTSSVTGSNTDFLADVSANSTFYVNNQSRIVQSVSSNTSLTLANNLTFGVTQGRALVLNPEKFTVRLSDGKAYVKGYEFENILTNLSLRRGRNFSNVSNYDLASTLGNYVFVNGVLGAPSIDEFETYDIHRVQANAFIGGVNVNTSIAYSNTVIGTAKIRAFEYVSSTNTSNTLTHVYKAYLTDVVISNSVYNFSHAQSLVKLVSTTNSNNIYTNSNSYNKVMQIDLSSKSNSNYFGNTFITDTAFNTLIFPYPQKFIKPGSISDVDYQYRKIEKNKEFTSGGSTSTTTITLTAPESWIGTGSLSDSAKLSNFTVVLRNKASSGSDALPASFGNFANGDIIPFNTAQGRSISIAGQTATFTFSNANTFRADIIYTVGLTGTAPGPRQKTLRVANTSNLMPTSANSGFVVNTNTAIFLTNAFVQIHVFNANNVIKDTANSQKLYISDVVQLKKVLDFGLHSNGTAKLIEPAHFSTASDITRSYSLDNGQRDNLYDHASIRLKPGSPAPRGSIVAYVDFYSHSGTSGYLTVDSYPSAPTNDGYAAIPIYLSPTTGVVYRLADCVDWRPVRTNAVENPSISNAVILQPDQSFVSDYSYYLGRIDKITLSSDRVFRVIEGVASEYPETPKHGDDEMLLYTLEIPPFTANVTDVNIKYTENKRYTMRDIGKLERRIENLEYYTSLNLLETSAEALSIKDSFGVERFKNGILVDNFSGHKVGDVTSPDYLCSLDFEKGELRPYFVGLNYKLAVESTGYNYSLNKTYATLDYDQEVFLEQDAVTSTTPINPFNFVIYYGTLSISPDNDTWVDVVNRPQVLVNLEGENDAWEAMASSPFGTKYGNWQTNWTGVATNEEKSSTTSKVGYITTETTVSRTIQTTEQRQSRSVSSFSVNPETITKQIGDNVVDVSILPYIRPQTIKIRGYNFRPGAILFPFFDDKRMIAHWRNPTVITVYDRNGTFDASNSEILTINGVDTARVTLFGGNTVIVYAGHTSINVGDTLQGKLSGAVGTVNDIISFSDIVPNTHSNSYILNLSKSASNVSNSIYAGTIVSICSGTGEGQFRIINSYDRVNRQLTLTEPFVVTPDSTSVYNIGFCQVLPNGFAAGSMVIPRNTFFTGQKKVRLTSSYINSTTELATYGDAVFFAQGLLQTKEKTSISTRVPRITVSTSSEERVTSESVISDVEVSQVQIRDDTPPPAPAPAPPITYNPNYGSTISTILNPVNTDRTGVTTDDRNLSATVGHAPINSIDCTNYQPYITSIGNNWSPPSSPNQTITSDTIIDPGNPALQCITISVPEGISSTTTITSCPTPGFTDQATSVIASGSIGTCGSSGTVAADQISAVNNSYNLTGDGGSHLGSSDSGGGKIVCSAMNREYGFGSFRQKIWLDHSIKNLKKEHEIGYHTLFLPLVNYAYYSKDKTKGTMVVRSILEHMARHRTADLWKRKRGKNRDFLGMVYGAIFVPLAYTIGYIKKNILKKVK